MRIFLAALVLSCSAVSAEVPRVVTDIAPVQSLTALVMGGLGQPDLLLDPQTDPHHFQMRPSQARMLARADMVVWMGPDLTPWLPRSMDNLGHVISLDLLGLDGTTMTINGDIDPHAWLDPLNAARYLDAIAGALALADPDNAAIYRENAAAGVVQMAAMAAELDVELAPIRSLTLISAHDAYGYFLARFGLSSAASLTDTDDAPPSAGQMAHISDLVSETPDACFLVGPDGNRDLIETLATPTSRLAMLDPLGRQIAPGADLYQQMIRDMARSLAGCTRQ